MKHSAVRRFVSYAPEKLAIKRVIRKGREYVCGICHHGHKSMDDAYGCLQHCLEDYFTQYPVRSHHEGNRLFARCIFCGRIYRDTDSALRCASECRDKFLKKANDEGAIARSTFLKATKKHDFSEPTTIVPFQQAVVLPFAKKEEPAPAEVKPETPVPAQASTDSAPDAAKKKKNPGGPKWHREQAKYVCNCCQAQFYTRVEAEACWDKHE